MYDFAMTSFVSKIYRRHFESMITKRESLNLAYIDSPGYEASEQALVLAQVTVYKAILQLETPKWAFKGDKQFRKFLKKYDQKLPEYDFYFLEEYMPRFWDSFRFILLRPDNMGSFQPVVTEELRSEFIKIFMDMPSKLRVKDGTELAATNLMLLALQICLDENKPLLANPVFEVVLLIWYHYVWPIA